MEKIEKNTYSIEELQKKFDSLWNINKNGRKDTTFIRYKKAVSEGNSPDEINNKYKTYYEMCKPHQNGKYTVKEYRIKEIEEFLKLAMYKREFKGISKSNPARDKYLYGI